MGNLFDRDVAERQHLGALHKARGTVHVPDPGVAHRHLVVDVAALGAHLEIDSVAEIETSFRLHCVGEDANDVLVLAIELKLQLAFVLFEILGTHSESTLAVRETSTPVDRETSTLDVLDTLMKRIRWVADGPYASSFSWCNGVQ